MTDQTVSSSPQAEETADLILSAGRHVIPTGIALFFVYLMIEVPEPGIWPREGLPIWLIKMVKMIALSGAVLMGIHGVLLYVRAIALEVAEKLKP